jgi:MFS transporter, UMF1 family
MAAEHSAARRTGFLEKLGLHRRELRAWAMYDWANSAFMTVVITSVFPIYYSTVASAGVPDTVATVRFTTATTLGLLFIGILAPILGAIADYAPLKKKMLGGFMILGVGSVLLMFFVHRGNWILGLSLFVLSNIGANGSFVFYDALLPHVAKEEEMDRVSTAGYALGYIGGGLLLAVNLAWIIRPEWFGLPHGDNLSANQQTLPTRLAFVSVAAWWVFFSLPLFRHVAEPPVRLASAKAPGRSLIGGAFRQLIETFAELRRFKNAFLMLLAFLIYNDGIGTIIRMAAMYGANIGIGQTQLISAILLTQFVGIPFAFLFGRIASAVGTKPAIYLSLTVYVGISIVGYFMKTAAHFLILAILVGMVQGGAQALSRSLFASLIPRSKAGEFFGFFAVVEKFAGIFGPLLFGMTAAGTGSNRYAILSVIAFFVVGGAILAFVDVNAGRRIASDEERRLNEIQSAAGPPPGAAL